MIVILELKDLSHTQALFAHCDCRQIAVKLDTAMLIEKLGANYPIRCVGEKVKCKVCGSKFSSIQIVSQLHVRP